MRGPHDEEGLGARRVGGRGGVRRAGGDRDSCRQIEPLGGVDGDRAQDLHSVPDLGEAGPVDLQEVHGLLDPAGGRVHGVEDAGAGHLGGVQGCLPREECAQPRARHAKGPHLGEGLGVVRPQVGVGKRDERGL